jgi:hypothetical protein
MASMSALSLLLILVPLAKAVAAGPPCEEVPRAESLLQPGTVVLLGEIHGTEEAPEAVLSLACHALSLGLTVTVGLEIPRSEQEDTDRYLASDGGLGDQRRLLASGWWQREFQDGRSSRAMFDLIRELRASGAHSADLRVILIDDPASPLGRDRAMASLLTAEIGRRPGDFFVVLTGNLHNLLVPERSEPMGYHLRTRNPDSRIIALNITHSGGTAWVCTRDGCGVVTSRGEDNVALGVGLYPQSIENAYTGRLHVGRITASPPAIGQ